jgi:Secretion system C-terminal sorting domain/FG-GAP repeat
MVRLITILVLIPTLCFGQWSQLGQDIDGQAANEQSGTSTSMNASGTTVIISAPRAMDAGLMKGKARVFEWNGSAWFQKGSDLVGTSDGDVFGDAVSMSANGNIIAVGAPGFLNPTFPPGYARVYEWNGTSWIQKGADIIGESTGDNCGGGVSLSDDGNTIAVGAYTNDGGGGNSGHCRVFAWNGSSWVKKGADIDGEAGNDFCGNSVSIAANGNMVAVGAAGHDGGGNGLGQIRVFEWIGSNWVQKGADVFGTSIVRGYGAELALSDDGTTFIGSGYTSANGSIGHIKMHNWDGSSWVQKGAILSGDGGSDFFGNSDVDINGDGSMVIAGGLTTGGSGYAKVFSFVGGAWVQQGPNIQGEASSDQFGRSVSMDSDGSILAIGTPFNDGNGTSAGHVRVFQNSSGLPIELGYFAGNYSNNAVILNWKVENQINFSHFDVEKSLDGTVFNGIGNIKLTNSELYYYKDIDLSKSSLFYYRLKMVDNDGSFSYSNIISIRTGQVNTFSILGNPVKDNLHLTGLKAGGTLTLYDNVGKMILQKNIEDESFFMDVSFLVNGVYFLQYSNDNVIGNKKIIKQ